MSNKKDGNDFETAFCEILFKLGFWCHRFVAHKDGQPADIIAVRNKRAYLIDCKVCQNDVFQFSRMEQNQVTAMDLWEQFGNGTGLFALSIQDKIYMIPKPFITKYLIKSKRKKQITYDELEKNCSMYEFRNWESKA